MKSFVIIPTYNESQNIRPLIKRLFELAIPDLNILVVDDSSPDGTASLVEDLLRSHQNLFILERKEQKGRGTAGIVGFDAALQLGADVIIEMDADFSHPPEVVPQLLNEIENADIVIASRLAHGSSDLRPKPRRFLTMLANWYARTFLESSHHSSRARDWTSGFRAYRKEVFRYVPLFTLISRGPSILQEVLYRALRAGLIAKEIPFQMPDRSFGKSSFGFLTAFESLYFIPVYAWLYGGKRGGFFLGNIEMKRKSSNPNSLEAIPIVEEERKYRKTEMSFLNR